MKVFVTGAPASSAATSSRQLRERGDEVRGARAQPREGRGPRRARLRARRGRPLRRGGDRDGHGGLRRGHPRGRDLRGRDPEVRAPGDVRRQRGAAPRRVLGAALAANVPKVVYVSTVGAFGNTHGEVVDETYEHPGRGFTSYYEETKYEAHQIAKRLIAEKGLPCVIVQPGGVYGPDDHSAIGTQIDQFLAGKLPAADLPRPRLQHGPRRRRRRRDPARPRQGQGRRGLRPRRRDHDDARACSRRWPTPRTASHRESPCPPA